MIKDKIPGTPMGFTDIYNHIFRHTSYIAGLIYRKEIIEVPAYIVAEQEGY